MLEIVYVDFAVDEVDASCFVACVGKVEDGVDGEHIESSFNDFSVFVGKDIAAFVAISAGKVRRVVAVGLAEFCGTARIP